MTIGERPSAVSSIVAAAIRSARCWSLASALGGDGRVELCLGAHQLIFQPSPARTHIVPRTRRP
jgi:hypothetical protein